MKREEDCYPAKREIKKNANDQKPSWTNVVSEQKCAPNSISDVPKNLTTAIIFSLIKENNIKQQTTCPTEWYLLSVRLSDQICSEQKKNLPITCHQPHGDCQEFMFSNRKGQA